MYEINKRIKYYRKRAGYLQSEMAQMLNMKVDTYAAMERKGKVYCENLIVLSELLHVKATTLLYGERDEPEIILPSEDEAGEAVDLWGVPILAAVDIYEKFAVLAMRNFPEKRKQQFYRFILDEFKHIDMISLRGRR